MPILMLSTIEARCADEAAGGEDGDLWPVLLRSTMEGTQHRRIGRLRFPNSVTVDGGNDSRDHQVHVWSAGLVSRASGPSFFALILPYATSRVRRGASGQ